jgi:hypothetical protein
MEKQAFKLNNLRQIKVKFLGPTNYNGARIKIYEPARYNDEKTKRKTFSYSYECGDVMEQAYEILTRNGFNVICRASEQDNYIFLCDNWSDEFKQVNELK